MAEHSNPAAPVALSFEAIDDLIYDARIGDLDALQADIAKWSTHHQVPASSIIQSANDNEAGSEGGTGACLLHWPAANGNAEILSYLIHTLTTEPNQDPAAVAKFLNYQNYTGNTPLHWAALNTHLECVKALVEAGADISLKNDAGHDALFLAERADWAVVNDDDDDHDKKEENDTTEMEIDVNKEGAEQEDNQQQQENKPPPTKARLVAEWLLGCDKGAGYEKPSTDTKRE